MGTAPTDVRVDYGPNELAMLIEPNVRTSAPVLSLCADPMPPTIEIGLQPGHTTHFAFHGARPCRYAGAATITSVAQQQLAAVVVQDGGVQSSAVPAVPYSRASSEVYVPRLVVDAGPERRYSEMAIRNLGDAETLVSIHYGPNRIAGLQPTDLTIAVGAGRTWIYDLSTRAVPFDGTVTLNSIGGAPLAVTVTEVALQPDGLTDHMASYNAISPPKTQAMIAQLRVPVRNLPMDPCQLFMNSIAAARDATTPGSKAISPALITPLPLVDCLETDDEEVAVRARTQGMLVTHDLPTFMQMDPLNGPLPTLLINTNPTFGNNTAENNSTAMIATTFPSSRARSVGANPMLQLAGMAAAWAAAEALAQGASQNMAHHVSRFDWYAGPIQYATNQPDPEKQFTDFDTRLQGTGVLTAGDSEELGFGALFGRIRQWLFGEATFNHPQGGPDGHHCRDGTLDAFGLGVNDQWFRLLADYSTLDKSTGHLLLRAATPKAAGHDALCGVLSRVASCARQISKRSTLAVSLKTGDRFVDSSLSEFPNLYWGDRYYVDARSGLSTWIIDLLDMQHPGWTCIGFDE